MHVTFQIPCYSGKNLKILIRGLILSISYLSLWNSAIYMECILLFARFFFCLIFNIKLFKSCISWDFMKRLQNWSVLVKEAFLTFLKAVYETLVCGIPLQNYIINMNQIFKSSNWREQKSIFHSFPLGQ